MSTHTIEYSTSTGWIDAPPTSNMVPHFFSEVVEVRD